MLAVALNGVGLVLLQLLEACNGGSDIVPEVDVTVSYGPAPPAEVTGADHSSPAGLVRVSKEILSGEKALCTMWGTSAPPVKKSGNDAHELSDERPFWDLSLLLEGSGTSSNAEFTDPHDFAVLGQRRLDPPVHLKLGWDITEMSAALVLRHDLGSIFDVTLGLGYGHAILDFKAMMDDGSSYKDRTTLNGLAVKIGVGAHAASWLEFAAGSDFLIASTSIVTLDALVIVRPWPHVGFIGGYRVWLYSDDKRSGSGIELTSSGPLLGLDLRF